MVAAGAFAGILIAGFIVLDWWYFGRPESQAMRYGCPIGAMTLETDRLPPEALGGRFGPTGVLALPHGLALWFPEGGRILLKPDSRRFAARFRTAWPLKGSVEVRHDGERTRLVCAKRIPWSSAAVTVLWFVLVCGGTAAFLVSFALQGGFGSMGSIMLGVGVLALGLLVLLFGIVTVALAYRIENGRLLQVWDEWQKALAATGPARAQ